VVVKGIPVFRKAALFAGRRWNEGLGRSVQQAAVPPLHATAPMTSDVRRSPRRGTSSACATEGMHLTATTRDRVCLRDTSFARSFDPCASILTMLCGESFGGEAVELVSRLGKLA